MKAFNAESDPRHVRREATHEEVDYLLRFVEGYKHPEQHHITGPDRARAYRVALGTGFRALELTCLTPASFQFGDSPTVTCKAAHAKNEELAEQPIRRDLADLLADWLKRPGTSPKG